MPPEEISRLRVRQILFCYFHFAVSRELTESCLKSGISAVADAFGDLPRQ
jgi:alanine dehydrogenase